MEDQLVMVEDQFLKSKQEKKGQKGQKPISEIENGLP